MAQAASLPSGATVQSCEEASLFHFSFASNLLALGTQNITGAQSQALWATTARGDNGNLGAMTERTREMPAQHKGGAANAEHSSQ